MAKTIKKETIHAAGIDIGIYTTDFKNEFISLTDIARYKSIDPRITIHNWLRGRDVVEFLGLWEILHNPDFKRIDFDTFKEDAGHSGKNINGRPEFSRMLEEIASGTDGVSYVLVFKLSRFGRNAADVLSSLQLMQDYGVNLICVEDGIDSSKEAGKLMISVLSAVAEIERENILVLTKEGRRQKAREGRWNGGFAPYGYTLVNGELIIAEDEAEIIRIIFDKYIHTNMGVNGVADYLNTHGYKKKKRQNNTLDAFASSFIKGVTGKSAILVFLTINPCRLNYCKSM